MKIQSTPLNTPKAYPAKERYLTESTFDLEEELASQGYRYIIGIDEAGRGPLAGPVVACAAVLRCHAELVSASRSKNMEILKQVQDDKNFNLIRDSKTLSEKQRESLFDFIQDNFHVGIGICDHRTIDRMNILEATYLAMKKAIAELLRACPLPPRRVRRDTLSRVQERGNMKMAMLLVDGNKAIPNLSMEQRAIVNGDKIVKSISAASIVAKVTRDRIMREAHEKYPEYCFDRHKGYGTAVHMEALKRYGPCDIHRKSFEPVSSFIKSKIKNQKSK